MNDNLRSLADARISAAKPTIFRGVIYRSRLEAKWAAMFSLLRWEFQYEPENLRGWLPDFLIQQGRHILYVECRPAYAQGEVRDRIERAIVDGGAAFSAMMVGEMPTYGRFGASLGEAFTDLSGGYEPIFGWDTADLTVPRRQSSPAYSLEISSGAPLLGGGNTCGKDRVEADLGHALSLWAKACNEVRFKGEPA